MGKQNIGGGFGMMGMAGPQEEQSAGTIAFYPLRVEELAGSGPYANQHSHVMQQLGLESKHFRYSCGACGDTTNGRVLCDVKRDDGSRVQWCWCSCDKSEPTVLIEKDGNIVMQLPIAKHFHANPKWPPELTALYDESSKAYSAGAFTACAMVCRKLLMATACKEGDSDGKSFGSYVTYITTTVLRFQRCSGNR